MSRLLVVLGGARSGKSGYAERRLLAVAGEEVTYLATLRRGSSGVNARIAEHARRRPAGWRTVEVGDGRLEAALARLPRRPGLLLDGFELVVAAAAPAGDPQAEALARSGASACRDRAGRLACIVSAEVGMGVVPASAAGVGFRDRVGIANQALAAEADEVVLVVAGQPLWLRGTAP